MSDSGQLARHALAPPLDGAVAHVETQRGRNDAVRPRARLKHKPLGCKRKPLKKHWIERVAVVTTVQRVLRDEEINRIADAIIDLQNREDTSIPAMRQQLKACEKAIENMLNAIQMESSKYFLFR